MLARGILRGRTFSLQLIISAPVSRRTFSATTILDQTTGYLSDALKRNPSQAAPSVKDKKRHPRQGQCNRGRRIPGAKPFGDPLEQFNMKLPSYQDGRAGCESNHCR